MNRIILALSLLLISFVARSERLWIEGDFGVQFDPYTSWGLTAAAGMPLSSAVGIGGEIEYTADWRANSIYGAIGPAVRAIPLKIGKVDIGAEIAMRYLWLRNSSVDMQLRPMVSYSLNDRVNIISKFKIFWLMYDFDYRSFDAYVGPELSVGLQFKF